MRVGNPPETARADGKTGDEVGKEQRLPGDLTDHRHHPGSDDANGDVGDQPVFHANRRLSAHLRLVEMGNERDSSAHVEMLI